MANSRQPEIDPGPPYFCVSGHEHLTKSETFDCDRAWQYDQDEQAWFEADGQGSD